MPHLRARPFGIFPAKFIPALLAGLLAVVVPATAGSLVVGWGAGVVSNNVNNNYGQSLPPAKLTNAVLVAGGFVDGLALKADGSLQGWGNNVAGETTFPNTNYWAIACGAAHSLALLTNGQVAAVGDDSYQQINVPANLSNVVAVACGFYHSLALRSDGTVVAWGTSTNSAVIGTDDTDYGQSLVPPGLSNVVAIAGGGFYSLALKADGTVTGWGQQDSGQLNFPAGLTNVVAIAAGGAHSLALKADGTVVACGTNIYGQLNIPAGLSNVVAIAAGADHSLALKADGTVVAWGAGTGTNTYVDHGQSTVPASLSNVVQIAAGLFNSLAVEGTGSPVWQVPLNVVSSKTSGFTVSLPTRNGRVYRLEYANSLTNQTWSAFPLQAGTGGTNRFTDPAPAATLRFYRVSQW